VGTVGWHDKEVNFALEAICGKLCGDMATMAIDNKQAAAAGLGGGEGTKCLTHH
jgi:hypothetical protein